MPQADALLQHHASSVMTAPAPTDDSLWISAPEHRLRHGSPEHHQHHEALPADWQVPEVDLSKNDADAAADLHRACSDVGFFYVTNHGVSEELLQRQFRESVAFFAQPMQEKLKLQADASNRGYHAPGLGTAKNPFAQADRKEAINLYLGFETDDAGKPFHGRNRWPDPEALPGFRPAMADYYRAMDVVSRRLLRLVAIGLDLHSAFFEESFSDAVSNVRAIHYLPGGHRAADGIFGVGAHTDWGALTVLATDDTPGLQIRHRGEWRDVAPRPDAFVVNVGDLLHHWTAGRFKSTLHRVEKRSAGERYSTPFFAAPNWDTVVAPLSSCGGAGAAAEYPPVTTGDWLMKRREAEYGVRQALRV